MNTHPAELHKIRQVRRSDLPALEWEGSYTRFRKLFRAAYQQAGRGKVVLWVATLNQKIVGQIFVQLESHLPQIADGHDRSYIYAFRVRPENQHMGIGTRLLENAETDLIARGFQVATLNVNKDNQAAILFYERRGYRIIGKTPGNWTYIDHTGQKREVSEPAFTMEKTLRGPE